MHRVSMYKEIAAVLSDQWGASRNAELAKACKFTYIVVDCGRMRPDTFIFASRVRLNISDGNFLYTYPDGWYVKFHRNDHELRSEVYIAGHRFKRCDYLDLLEFIGNKTGIDKATIHRWILKMSCSIGISKGTCVYNDDDITQYRVI